MQIAIRSHCLTAINLKVMTAWLTFLLKPLMLSWKYTKLWIAGNVSLPLCPPSVESRSACHYIQERLFRKPKTYLFKLAFNIFLLMQFNVTIFSLLFIYLFEYIYYPLSIYVIMISFLIIYFFMVNPNVQAIPSLWRRSWARRRSSLFTGQSTFPSSPIVTSCG